MLFNDIKTAWRNILKTKGYSAINISGLAVGIAIAMLIGLWLYDELQFNKYHRNYSHIAQVMVNGNFNGQKFTASSMSRPLEFILRNKYGGNFKHIVMSRYNVIFFLWEKKKFLRPEGSCNPVFATCYL
jgi:putative ABC transport system permease protein